MKENAEADGIEVYDIDSLAEFSQLFATIGQSVCLFGNPKKCAQALQQNRKANQKLHSKILLLSQKNIPRKTLEKFEKIGLTDCIVEPVVPKTLMYKVRLQLKSIQTVQEQEEMNRKFGQDEKEKDQEEAKVKKKASKDQEDDEQDDLYSTQKKTRQDESDEDLYARSSKGESLDGHLRGDVHYKEETDDKETGKSSNSENIETYLKGKTKKSTDIDVEDEEESKEAKEEVDEDLIDELKSKLDLDIDIESEHADKVKQFEEELEQKKKEQKKLALEEERKKNLEKNNREEIDGHLRGKVHNDQPLATDEEATTDDSSALPDEEEDELMAKLDLEVLEERNQKEQEQTAQKDDQARTDREGYRDQIDGPTISKSQGYREQEEGHLSGQSKRDDQDGPEPERESQGYKDEIAGPKINKSEGYRDQDDGHLSGEGKLTKKPLDDRPPHEADTDHIETMIKGSLDHRSEEKKEKKERESNSHTDEEDEDRQSQQKTEISLEQNNQRDQKAQNEDLEKDSEENRSRNEQQDEISPHHREKLSTEQKTRERDAHTAREEERAEFNHGEGWSEQKKNRSHEADARADRIQTHYKGTGNSHQDQGWDIKDRTRPDEEIDLKKKRSTSQSEQDKGFDYDREENGARKKKSEATPFVYEGSAQGKKAHPQYEGSDGREDQESQQEYGQAGQDSGNINYDSAGLGEQVIDYGKLHQEFYGLEDKTIEDITSEEYLYSEDNLDDDELSETLIDLQNEVIEPVPQCLDLLLRANEFYIQKPGQEVIQQITQQIEQRFNAHCSLFLHKEGQWQEVYEGPRTNHAVWQTIKESSMSIWTRFTTPQLADPSFSEDDNQYIYPYFQNQKKVGFVVVTFDHDANKKLNNEKLAALNTALQSYRPYLYENSQEKIQESKTAQVRQSFLDRFLGKKAS